MTSSSTTLRLLAAAGSSATTFRATGLTAYLENGGKLKTAQAMANHSLPRTTQLYDRREDEVTISEVKRVLI